MRTALICLAGILTIIYGPIVVAVAAFTLAVLWVTASRHGQRRQTRRVKRALR